MNNRQLFHRFIVIGLFLATSFCIQSQTIIKVPARPYETCITDYDQDGDNDIIVACEGLNQDPDSIAILLNDGWGNFESESFQAPNQIELHCIDLTQDNYPDIITQTTDNIVYYENDKAGGVNDSYLIMNIDCSPKIGGLADIDFDYNNDIVYYCRFPPYSWGVQFNNGDYTFTDSAFIENSETWHRPNVGKINMDSRPDIVLATLIQEESLDILYNFYPEFTVSQLASPDWGHTHIMKLDNDSLNDILLERPLSIGSTWLSGRLNKGDHFRPCDTLVYPNGAGIKNTCDYNLDGYDDMTMTTWEEDSIYIYFNSQSCGFTHSQSVYMGDYSWLPTVNHGDLNGDGYPELVIQGYHMPRNSIRILWNDGTGHFIDTNTVYVYQNEFKLTEQIRIYPNPAISFLSIEIPKSLTDQKTRIEIINIKGRTELKKSIKASTSEFDIGNLNPGIYLIKIKTDQKIFIKKFIKQ